MSKGVIVLLPFPFSDLSGQKVRPALILFSAKKDDDCMVAFISSKKEKKRSRFDIFVRASTQNGLKFDSVVRIDKIATLQKKIILGELGILEPTLCKEVNNKLKELFDL